MLVRLLARLAARECLVVLSSSAAAANTSAASHPTPNEEKNRHE